MWIFWFQDPGAEIYACLCFTLISFAFTLGNTSLFVTHTRFINWISTNDIMKGRHIGVSRSIHAPYILAVARACFIQFQCDAWNGLFCIIMHLTKKVIPLRHFFLISKLFV